MKSYVVLLAILCVVPSTACAQSARPDLYDCEGCEAIYEHSFEDLSWHTTIPPDDEPGAPMVISGTVYQPDGETPAPNVIVYAYHTNAQGVYPTRGDETGWARRHGYLRGWMKTDADGRYRFETIRPASYPNRDAPAHVHLIVKEPDRREYWIESIKFEGDPYLNHDQSASSDPRGGPGIIELTRDEHGVWRGVRDIVLEP